MDVGIKTDQYLAPPLVQCSASVVTYRGEGRKENSIFEHQIIGVHGSSKYRKQGANFYSEGV
jgi:hypothetical protein